MNTDPSGLLLEPLSNLGMSDFTRGLNNFNSQFNNFIDHYNPLSYPKSGAGITGYDLDGVPSFNQRDRAFHSHSISSSCNKGSSCTTSLAWEGLQRYLFPGSNGSKIQDEQISDIFIIGAVRTEVYQSRQMIINVTLPGQHMLYPGVVMRYISEDANKIYINTHGEGTGQYPGVNNTLAGKLWGDVDSQIFEWMRNNK